jgi:hypothetical protein
MMILSPRQFPAPAAMLLLALFCSTAVADGTYPMLETTFQLPGIHGNPFDYTENDVQVGFARAGAPPINVPAFFDGGTTWRARFTPTAPGVYFVKSVTLNGKPINPAQINPSDFHVSDTSRPGFIRIDPKDRMRFLFDDGSPFYPVGFDLAWHADGDPPLIQTLARMGQARVNWTRIWMCHWDGKNLDWPEDTSDPIPPGQLNLATARLWDQIVSTADANGIHFQLVLQHHGQYTIDPNPNWGQNPWNKANGGWLEKPEDFFTDPRAIALTQKKFRYIIARWGYSPSIMAWELFNEVEFTDGFHKNLDGVAAWLQTMAAFIRGQDPYHHLITVSSRIDEPKLWPAMDYYQSHVYAPDVVSEMALLDDHRLDRPYFYGEYGGFEGGEGANSNEALHSGLWASLMSQASGAAMFWFWDAIAARNLFDQYTAAQDFISKSAMLDAGKMEPMEVVPSTPQIGPLRFGPGSSWSPASVTDYTIKPSGVVEGIGGMSAFLQGNNKNKKMFPYAVFQVNYPSAGTFSITIDQMTPDGARLEVTLDGAPVAALDLAPTPSRPPGPDGKAPPRPNPHINESLEIPVSRGSHAIHLENTGADWIHINHFILNPYCPQLGVLAKGNTNLIVMWVFNRDQQKGRTVAGSLQISSPQPGAYTINWLDTRSGEIIKTDSANVLPGGALTLTTPAIAEDAACWIRRSQ